MLVATVIITYNTPVLAYRGNTLVRGVFFFFSLTQISMSIFFAQSVSLYWDCEKCCYKPSFGHFHCTEEKKKNRFIICIRIDHMKTYCCYWWFDVTLAGKIISWYVCKNKGKSRDGKIKSRKIFNKPIYMKILFTHSHKILNNSYIHCVL